MSLRFCFGGSGAGKSTTLYKEIIERAQKEPKRNFLILVPDQFTMQTQKELVTASYNSRGGILNVDVLSFGRLSHRIFEEVGREETPVLDDTGKSLVLRKVAGELKDKLPILGGNLDKQGYVHEVKSAISEFMQYGIGVEDVSKLISFSEKKGALCYKLKDLEVLYRGFTEYIANKFVTTEETTGLLARALSRSEIVKDSVVVFDGFTGFTPIQYRVIAALLDLSSEVIVSLVLGDEEDPFTDSSEQSLFHLSKKTVKDLSRLASEAGIPRGKDMIRKGTVRFGDNLALTHLERNLFRYPVKAFNEVQNNIHLMEMTSPREEVRQCGLIIERLIREEKLLYRDIAVVTGDLGVYGEQVEEEFATLDIPFYLDATRGIVLNPFIEYIRSVFEILNRDFSYESVFALLRCGLTDITREDVDLLENYVIATGIRGQSRWNRMFTRKTDWMGEDTDALQHMNELRERVLAMLGPMLSVKGKASDYVQALYQMLTGLQAAEKLHAYELQFEAKKEAAKAKEYAQVYRLVMELLEQLEELLGDEKMNLQEFGDILDAGFGEIEVGTIPQNVDRVLVGDMERTRLKEVKILFFLGVNDGNIPKSAGKGGIISDMDREFLRESNMELAPSPRQQMFIQKLYLYLNMTKPSERLYLSYARVGSDGKALRPSYLIETMTRLFPALVTKYPEQYDKLDQIVTRASGRRYLAEELREYADGYLKDNKLSDFYTLYTSYEEQDILNKLCEAAFYRYEQKGLGKEVARALYGQLLQNSVSRLETYAACAYEQFLQYGLNLKEREEFGFEAVDMGNIYHGVLERFAGSLEESDYTWFNFTDEFANKAVAAAMEKCAVEYGNTILFSSARNEYAVKRMTRVLLRTVKTMQYQLQKGQFTPGSYEISFSSASDLDSVNIALSDAEAMKLRGRIDRVDISEDDRHVYVKVVDYKSGNHKFDLVALYYGLQLQLVVYMNAAIELEKRKYPDKEVIPAAMLYYHVADPATEVSGEITPEELNAQLISELRTTGVVNDREEVILRLDSTLDGKSDVVPIEQKKDGSLSAKSSALSQEELQTVSTYVNQKVRQLGADILSGNISLHPYENGNREACTYCSFKGVCGFDTKMPGMKMNKLGDMSEEEALAAMQCEKCF